MTDDPDFVWDKSVWSEVDELPDYQPYYPLKLPPQEVMDEINKTHLQEVPMPFWPDGVGLRIIRYEIKKAMAKDCATCAQCQREPKLSRLIPSWLFALKRRLPW